VVIKLSKPNFDAYIGLRNAPAYHPVLASTIVVPALVDIIDRIRRVAITGDLDSYSELRWFIVVTRKLRDFKINPEDPDSFDSSLKIAHMLLGEPLSLSLTGLKGIAEDDE
jgi:hypothetical protein